MASETMRGFILERVLLPLVVDSSWLTLPNVL
jgi:hypothetical protein